MTAQQRSSPDGQRAFATLCETYWRPLYAYARQRVSNTEDARDLVQGFFLKVMEKNYLQDADPNRGRFRTFLLASLGHFMANEWNKAKTQKRGGDRVQLSLNFQDGDRLHALEPVDESTPEHRYNRLWAMTLLQEVLDQLRAEYAAVGKLDFFEQCQPFLTGDEVENHRTVGERLGMSEGAVRVSVHRLRARYREMLRAEIMKTVGDPSEVDDEVRRLFETFSSKSV